MATAIALSSGGKLTHQGSDDRQVQPKQWDPWVSRFCVEYEETLAFQLVVEPFLGTLSTVAMSTRDRKRSRVL